MASMTLIRDIDLFDDQDLLRRITLTSLVTLGVGVALVVAWLVSGWSHEQVGPLWLVGAVVATLVSFGVHELVHGVLFKVYGGSKAHVSFGARAGMLYATAPGLVLTRHRFEVVLMAPTILVSLASLVPLVWGCPLMCVVVCLIHLSGCAGDWAFARIIHQDHLVVTCEDTDRGIRLYGL
ncbi:MAG: DUF3267 domain-containing protein [Atopobiaceae bacterium]|jgi:hypothetical protein|nr:DUF3267 domain-containing protein [Atopobiaceae bacterium]MCH4181011.1 DUF3267 domain-containing protein [Atopobiaceae bacterium]MCH4214923.1 DUF3267 domain-containing protein [Atopobiaceae bacterium]MCH4229749.1 DUF3267 domain-containing protein [Atopobiaceae bacterium]MCH4276054.1 DUF3267 domain-containing protein [Atopobiaceae bacterium]